MVRQTAFWRGQGLARKAATVMYSMVVLLCWAAPQPSRAMTNESDLPIAGGTHSGLETIQLHPSAQLAAALRRLPPLSRMAAQPAASQPRAEQNQVIARLDFTDEVFPPSGWTVTDMLADQQGVPPRLQWQRRTCDFASAPAMGWALGGGTIGGPMDCGTKRSDPVFTSLQFGPIDMSPYPGGLQIEYRVKLDAPDRPNDPAFLACAAATNQSDLDCYYLTASKIPAWGQVQPAVFTELGDSHEAMFTFIYIDTEPTEPHFGALIDDVVLTGLGGVAVSPTPTPTSTPGAGATATPHPARTATPRSINPDWTMVFHEDFSTDTRVFPLTMTGDFRGLVHDGEYVVIVGGNTFLRLIDISLTFTTVAVEVSAQTLAVPRAMQSYGLAMGRYRFLVSPARGTYSLLRRADDGWMYFVIDEEPSDAIRRDDGVNVLRIEYQGDTLRLLVNGIELSRLDNRTDVGGHIGLSARPPEQSSQVGEARFDDFIVEVPHMPMVPTASGTRTPGPPSTPVNGIPTMTPEGRGRSALLPLVVRDASSASLPTTEPLPAGQVDIRFGVSIGVDGTLVEPGTSWERGITTLYSRLEYAGVVPGTRLSWTWHYNGQLVEVEALNSETVVSTAAGHIDLGVTTVSGKPLPEGIYEVRAYLGSPPHLAGVAQGRISRDPPPGATARPIILPTVTPTPTGTCRSVLANPGFENGIDGWRAAASQSAGYRDMSDLIRVGDGLDPPVQAAEGAWLARVGGAERSQVHLFATSAFTLLTPIEIASASLSFRILVTTEENLDDESNDWLGTTIVNQDGSEAVIVPLGASDEWASENGWQLVGPLDVAPLLTQRPGWNTATLRFVNHTDDDARQTVFHLDDVSLNVCLREAAPRPTDRIESAEHFTTASKTFVGANNPRSPQPLAAHLLWQDDKVEQSSKPIRRGTR